MMIFIQKAQVLGLLLLVSSSYHRHQRFIMVEGRRALRDGHRPSIDEEKKSRETAAMSSEIPSPRIIGGSDASPNLYNWFARGVHIGEDGDERWLGCGGSLVSPEFVLTAAHCSFDNSSGFQIGALCEPFGESDNCGQYMETIYAKEVFTHHKYENILGGHDFQLVQLKSQSSIEPISMDQEDDSTSYSPGHPLWLIGFGAYFTFGHASLMPDHLQHVEVGYVDSDNCTEINAENGVYWTIKDNMMCAGNPLLHETEIGSCRGDSGGPLLDKESGKLVGVLSGSVKVGGECGKTPGVYGRISDQWPWIRETICESHSELNLPAYCENFTPYPSPSPTNSPTFGSCEDNEITVEVNVYTDSHPHEISWEIIDENTAEKIAGFEGYVSLYKLHEHQYCFPSDSCLRFEIKDSYYGDGIHPIYGYNVTVDRNVTIATSYDDPNGDFGSSENVRFGKGCTPTVSPTQSPSTSCSGINDIKVDLKLTTDYYTAETTWDITDIGGNIIEAGSALPFESFEEYEMSYCVDRTGCYSFNMYDSYYDGIDCGLDECYIVSYDGSMIFSGSVQGESGLFGDGCPTPSMNPSMSSTPSTFCSGAENATVLLELTTDDYYAETTWDITDIDGNVIEAGSALTFDPFTEYDLEYCVDKSGCYSFNMYDYYSDGISCGLDECYKVSYEGSVVLSGTDSGESGLFGDGCPSMSPSLSSTSCSGINDIKVDLKLTTDYYTAETSWDITDIDGNVIEAGSALPFESFEEYEMSYCVDRTGCYSFNMYDSYYDGIDCGLDECYSVSYDGSMIFSGSIQGESGLFGDGCPSMSPSLSSSSSSCSGINDVKVDLKLTTDYYTAETSWDITDIDGNVIEAGSALAYDCMEEYEMSYCVDRTGCYSFNMYDSYYDGIDCGLDECYSVSYDGLMIFSGSIQGESGLFGNGCPSLSPSMPQTMPPTIAPTKDSYCVDDASYSFLTKNDKEKDCKWLSKRYNRQAKYCDVKAAGETKEIKFFCKDACKEYIPRCFVAPAPTIPTLSPSMSVHDNPSPTFECVDDTVITFEIKKGRTKDCEWLSEKGNRAEKYCGMRAIDKGGARKARIKSACRRTCSKFLSQCSS